MFMACKHDGLLACLLASRMKSSQGLLTSIKFRCKESTLSAIQARSLYEMGRRKNNLMPAACLDACMHACSDITSRDGLDMPASNVTEASWILVLSEVDIDDRLFASGSPNTCRTEENDYQKQI